MKEKYMPCATNTFYRYVAEEVCRKLFGESAVTLFFHILYTVVQGFLHQAVGFTVMQ